MSQYQLVLVQDEAFVAHQSNSRQLTPAIQLVTSSETVKMVRDEDAVCLTDAPLPMELHEYRQFTYKRFTVNVLEQEFGVPWCG